MRDYGSVHQYFRQAQQGSSLDCRSLEFECFPFPFHNVAILLFNTNVSHTLASSEYNRRRMECGEGVALIRRNFPHVQSLRDVTLEMLEEAAPILGPILFRRCKYVVEENVRSVAGMRGVE